MKSLRWYGTRHIARAIWCAALLTLAGCGGGGGVGSVGTTQSPDPAVQDFPIAYVKRPLPVDNQGNPVQSDARAPLAFNAGGDLWLRDRASPTAQERNLTASFTGGQGDVEGVDVSFDGTKLVFAMHAPLIKGAQPQDQPPWNIWEYDLKAGTLTRLTVTSTAGAGQDVSPHYLPDGRIVFASTRQTQSQAVLLDEGKSGFSALDEDGRAQAVNLHVMDSDGSNIHQITFNQSDDLDPTVLSDGSILFSRWDHMGSRNAVSLYRVDPDGTQLHLVYGTQSHATGTNGGVIQFLKPHEMPDGRIMTIVAPFTGTDTGGAVEAIDTAHFVDNTTPTWSNQGLSGPAQTAATINNVNTNTGPSPGGRFRAAYPLWDGTNRALVAWAPCLLMQNTTVVACTPSLLAAANVQEAPPVYGVYVYDMANNTQLPVVVPQQGFTYTDVAVVQARQLPQIIPAAVAGSNPNDLTQSYINQGVGVLDIRSVYDLDGSFNALGTSAADINGVADFADPTKATADQHPARFLRIVKAVSIPDRTVRQFNTNAAFGNGGQRMREIIGYAPIEPDGSVKVKVPANAAIALSVVDKDGRRIGPRHQNWLQVRPGETLYCNGCHDPANGGQHGRPDGPPPVNAGASADGYQWPNTDPTWFGNAGDTMAEARTRIDPSALTPSVDLIYTDVWTPVTGTKNPDLTLLYSDLTTPPPLPVGSSCETSWSNAPPSCRVVINYEQHIQPLWDLDRGANTCISCHTTNSGAKVPDGQLDLTNTVQNGQFISYVQLLTTHDQLQLVGNSLQPVQVQATDPVTGQLLFVTDSNGNQVLDPVTGQPIPIMVTLTVSAPMSSAGARASTGFFSEFDAGGTHAGRLTPAELRLIAEWLDIGAQYYNNPFDAPLQ